MIEPNKLHRFAPNVIQGPFTHDTQEHIDWETAEHRKLLSLDGYSFLRRIARIGLLLVVLAFVAGIVTSLLHIDLSALAYLPWGHQ